jgi:hypothetical protein
MKSIDGCLAGRGRKGTLECRGLREKARHVIRAVHSRKLGRPSHLTQ